MTRVPKIMAVLAAVAKYNWAVPKFGSGTTRRSVYVPDCEKKGDTRLR